MNHRFPISLLFVLLFSFKVNAVSSADRVVLIQPIWDDSRPHYATIAGGRRGDHDLVLMKEGRHFPSDEWIMHEVRSGVFTFRSRDPFYPNAFLSVNRARRTPHPEIPNIHPAIVDQTLVPDQYEFWEVSEHEPGIYTISPQLKPRGGEILLRYASQDWKYKGFHIAPACLGKVEESHFRLIDVGLSKPAGQVLP